MNSSGQWVSSGGYWDESYEKYNCYSYAIGITDSWYDPGEISDPHNRITDPSASNLAQLVKTDLVFLGYNVEEPTNIPPNPATLKPWQELICIREGVILDGDWDIEEGSTYHFMKYNADDDCWFHKPGEGVPMKYLHEPADIIWNYAKEEYEDRWLSEISWKGYEFSWRTYYFGDIYYIVYSDPIGSFDIMFDYHKWNSRGEGLDYTGPIGTLTLYKTGHWILKEKETLYNYFVIFDPETDKFADYLKWDIPSEMTNYLADNALMIEAPLTVELLFYNSHIFTYGSFSMDFIILGTGGGIIRQDENIFSDNQGVEYKPYPITVQPENGEVTYAPAIIDYYDVYFNQSNLYPPSRVPNTNRRGFGSGKIGRFTLYANDIWTLSPQDDYASYIISFNPETDSFFNALDWVPDSGTMTTYLSTWQKAAKIPLTVEFPAFVDNNVFLGSYSLEVKMSGAGAELIECSDHVDVVQDSINYVPYQVWVYPVIGELLPDEVQPLGQRRAR